MARAQFSVFSAGWYPPPRLGPVLCPECLSLASLGFNFSASPLGEINSPADQLGSEPGSNCCLCSLLACALLSTPAPSALSMSQFLSHLDFPAWGTGGHLLGRALWTGPWHLAYPPAIDFSFFINPLTSFICWFLLLPPPSEGPCGFVFV